MQKGHKAKILSKYYEAENSKESPSTHIFVSKLRTALNHFNQSQCVNFYKCANVRMDIKYAQFSRIKLLEGRNENEKTACTYLL